VFSGFCAEWQLRRDGNCGGMGRFFVDALQAFEEWDTEDGVRLIPFKRARRQFLEMSGLRR
jgi:hypothetical protein